MMLYSTQSFCFDHPTEKGTTYLLPANQFISDAPAWIKDTVLWPLATLDLPGKPAKILIVNSSIKRAIELEHGDPSKLQDATSTIKTRNRGGKAPKQEQPAATVNGGDVKPDSGVVTVTESGKLINNE